MCIMSNRTFFSLSQVTARVRGILEPYMTKRFWVKAEISGLSAGRGDHYFFDLIESAGQGKPVARMRCVLWASDYRGISSRFKKENIEFQLKNGITVGVECSLDYHVTEGIRLKVHDSDVEFALGELELKKRRIIDALKAEGADLLNKALKAPLLPMKLGLITSRGSAAFEDIRKTLAESMAGFRVLLADSVMQGEQAQASILRALDALDTSGVQIVIIARGGGSKTDLSYLDDEAIARRISRLSIPVWTAIGHEIDSGVLDVVANQSFKTPTALAEELAGRFERERTKAATAIRRLHREWKHRCELERGFIGRSITGVRQGTRKLAEVTGEALDLRITNFRRLFELTMSGKMNLLIMSMRRIKDRTDVALGEAREALAGGTARLRSVPNAILRNNSLNILQIKGRLHYARISRRLTADAGELAAYRDRLRAGAGRLLKGKGGENEHLGIRVHSHDPRNALKRGYAIIRGSGGGIIRKLQQIGMPAEVIVEMQDGSAEGRITKIKETQ